MPGHASSPYWAAVDFDSEGDEETSPNSSHHRVYLDPWDSEQYSFGRTDPGESSQGENFNSMAGEPVSASFYYVPTKNESDEDEGEEEHRAMAPAVEELSAYRQQRRSRQHHHHVDHHHPEMFNYGYEIMPMPERRRSIYNGEDPYFALQPMVYEPIYHPLPTPMLPPPGIFMSPPPPVVRKRVSLPAPPHPEYVMATLKNGKHRRPSRYTDACDRYAYETLMYEYGAMGPAHAHEDWTRRALPKSAPDNFHLSRYGHLKIDYSCSWSSLDRLIRNQ